MCGQITTYLVTKQRNLVSKRNSIEELKSQGPIPLTKLDDFQYKVWFVQYDFQKFVFGRQLEFGKIFDQLEATFIANVYVYNDAPLLWKAGFSLTHRKQNNFE